METILSSHIDDLKKHPCTPIRCSSTFKFMEFCELQINPITSNFDRDVAG